MANDGWEDAPSSVAAPTTSSSDGWEDAPKGASSLGEWEDAPNQSDAETNRLKRQGQKTTLAMSAKENPLVGGLEAAGSMVAGIPAQIAGGLAGLGTLLSGQGLDKAAAVSEGTQQRNFGFGQYKPSTETGKYYSDKLQSAFAYPGEKAGDVGAAIGKFIDPKYENLGRLTGQLPVDAAMNFIGPEMFHGSGKFLTRERASKVDPVHAALDDIVAKRDAADGWETAKQTEMFDEKGNPTPEAAQPEIKASEPVQGDLFEDSNTTPQEAPESPAEPSKVPVEEAPQNGSWYTGSPEPLEQTRSLEEQSQRPNAEDQLAGPGHYITQSKDLAGVYGGPEGRMYSVNEPFKNAYDLNKPGFQSDYDLNLEHYGSKADVNKILQNRGFDAITFTNGRGEKIANIFNKAGVTDIGPAREPVKPFGELSLETPEQAAMRGPVSQRGNAPIINDAADLFKRGWASLSELLPNKFPTAEGKQFSSGLSGTWKGKSLPSHAMYREMDGGGLDDLLTKDRYFDERPNGMFVTDNKDLAIGQGYNKGVHVEFRGDGLSGKEHQKPGLGIIKGSGSEYIVDGIAPRAVMSVEMAPKTSIRGLTKRVLQTDFTKEVLPNGNLKFTRKIDWEDGITVPKSQQGSAPIINDLAKGVEKLLGKADGRTPEEKALERATGLDTIGKGVSWASVKDSILGEKDGRELFTNLQSGLQHAADKVSSGLMTFTARHLAWADKTTNALNKSVVLPLERTLGTLTPKQMVRTMGVMRREMFQRQVFTPAELRSAGMSDKEINAYSKVREAFQDNLKMQNNSRAKLGQEPITPQAAYLASQWQGNWHLPVKDMEGRLVGYLKLDTKIEMNKAVDYLRKNMPDLDLKNPQIEYHGDKLGNKAPRDLLGAYQDVLKNLEDGDKVNAVREAIRAHIEDKAYTFQQHQQHFENKANIRFFQGDRPWLSDHANAYAQAKAQMSYLKESNKWAPLQEALANIKEAMSDKDLAASQPNNMRVTKAYVAKAMGLSTSAFKNIESYVAKQVGTYKALNLASKVVPTVHIMKEVTYLAQLGASGGYAIATPLQALLFGPSLHMRLSNQGYEHTALASTLKTAIDAPLAMNKATWGGMSKTGQAAMKYGEANGLIDMNIRDDNRSVGSGISNRAVGLREAGKAVDTAKNILNWTISAPEKVARTATFLSFVHHLDASGKYEGNREAMFQKAEDYTNHTLTDFSRQARPLAADKGGPIGELFYVYKSPIVNMWNNLSALAKDAQAGKGVMPFATALGMIAVLAGPMNMPLMNEYNDIMGYVKQIMARTTPGAYAASQKNPIAHTITSPKEVWIEQAQHVAAMGPGYKMLANTMTNGLPSATLGVNLSSRFGGNSVDLSGLLSNSAPIGQEVKEQAPAAEWLTNPNTTHATQWAYNNSPPAIQGAMENNMDAFGHDRANGSRTANQASDLEAHKLSYVRRPADQVASSEGLFPNMVGESGVRYGGMTSVAEANTKATRAIINQKQMDSKAAQEKSMTDMFDDIKNQRGSTAISRSAQNYVANGGDGETFQRDFSAVINASALTPEQRALMSTTSLQAINKIVLINKLMKH